MINWKGCGRNQSWIVLSYCCKFSWRMKETNEKPVRIVDVLANV
jgi:hypothetical protein